MYSRSRSINCQIRAQLWKAGKSLRNVFVKRALSFLCVLSGAFFPYLRNAVSSPGFIASAAPHALSTLAFFRFVPHLFFSCSCVFLLRIYIQPARGFFYYSSWSTSSSPTNGLVFEFWLNAPLFRVRVCAFKISSSAPEKARLFFFPENYCFFKTHPPISGWSPFFSTLAIIIIPYPLITPLFFSFLHRSPAPFPYIFNRPWTTLYFEDSASEREWVLQNYHTIQRYPSRALSSGSFPLFSFSSSRGSPARVTQVRLKRAPTLARSKDGRRSCVKLIVLRI